MISLEHLPNQRRNEEVELFLRRHWITITTQLISFAILLVVPFLLSVVFWSDLVQLLKHNIFGPLITIAASIYILAIWLYAFIEFTDYYLDTWIVTNERILNIEQEGLFHRTTSELDLAAVQDVTSDVQGIARTLIDYGNIYIQTAGTKARFIFKVVPAPSKATRRIAQLVEADKRRHGMKELQKNLKTKIEKKIKK